MIAAEGARTPDTASRDAPSKNGWEGGRVPLTTDLGYWALCVAVSTTVFALVAAWYIWPALTRHAPSRALVPLLLFSSGRVAGLLFLVPGLVGRGMPAPFAVPTAYGDGAAAVLAVAAAVALRHDRWIGRVLAWAYSVIGMIDLANAGAQSVRHGVGPADFGTTWILSVFNVPALLVTHVLIVAVLWRRPGARPSRDR